MIPPDTTDPGGDQSRLLAVEERLTFQQRLLDQLNEVVLAHDRRLEQLGRELTRCSGALERLAAASGDDLPHEKPPHY